MPILTVTVENADELLNASYLGAGALIRVERSATGGGSGYSEISTTALVSGTRTYTVYDLAGAVSSWYRIRYSKSDGSSPSSYGDEFQAGDETGGLLCSWYDVQQELGETLSDSNKELVIDKIRQVSAAIEGYTGRWFAPRPASGTATYRFHTCYGLTLRVPKGVRSISTLAVATQDQPETGGTYTTATSTDYYVDPPEIQRDAGWPATAIKFRNTTSTIFYDAAYGAQVTGAFGWAAVPYDVQGVAIRAVVRRYLSKGGGALAVPTGPEGTMRLLPDMSGADRMTLDFYREIP